MRPRKIQGIEEYEDIQDIEENWYIQEEAAIGTQLENLILQDSGSISDCKDS